MASNSVSRTTFDAICLLLLLSSFGCEAQLSGENYYYAKCPKALFTIRTVIRSAIAKERRMAASLIRLHFHDCFVEGCDGSVLLDDSPTIKSEKNSLANKNSARGFNVIEDAKRAVEAMCPGVVSCADILAVAARDSSVAVGGPSWGVQLGRRDSTTANVANADANLPSPFSDLQTLIAKFAVKGLSAREMVALSGSHTLGFAQCRTFRQRIYNGTDINPGFAITRRRTCPQTGGDANLAPLDLVTPGSFDNNYFKNLRQKKGLLISDQVLFSGGTTDSTVFGYATNPASFAADFAAAMIKMGNLSPLTGQNGVIRKICSAVPAN